MSFSATRQTATYYRITAQGVLSQRGAKALSGLDIVARREGGVPVVTLTGRLADQHALFAALSQLYSQGLVLLGVEQLPGDPTPVERSVALHTGQVTLHMLDQTSSEWAEAIRQGLYAYNRAQVGSRSFHELAVVLRDESGQVVGGLLGGTIWRWLLIETLWVDERLRSQGYGSRLIEAAETAARERGCTDAILETFSFQALPFYQRHGYLVYAQLDGFPTGHTRYSLKKELAAHGEVERPRAVSHEALGALRHRPSQLPAQQDAYLATLHEITLDLLNRRSQDELLQRIVERAAAILQAPYAEIMLVEGDELVVRAFTANQPYLRGDRVRRGEALVSWRAHDTRQPVLVDDYFTWSGRRVLYEGEQLRAVADFPIVVGETCLGVLALGRVLEGHVFGPEDVHRGMQFSQLVALVLDNAALYATALQEIAERKEAEQALQHYANELELQNAELNAFAHTVAHDLKTPLTAVIGYSQMLRLGGETIEPTLRHDLLADIEHTGRKMGCIVEALLLLGKVRSQEAVPRRELEMGRLVGEVLVRVRQQAAQAGATLLQPPSWPLVLGYGPWVEEVWANYISNAIKYGGEPPLVELGATPTGDGFVRFWVRDNGPGLLPAQQARLFTPFTRLHTDRIEGHGLGLSIVQRIVQRLGGQVGVESEPGRGCTFFFTLPLA
ncbi:MAG: hypothetical protein OHK0022_30610 [Roseiflexaceae bacterium]